MQVGEREVEVHESLWQIATKSWMQLAVKANKQQDREQASEQEQVDLGIESLRLKSCSKKVIRQLMSMGKKAKKPTRIVNKDHQ